MPLDERAIIAGCSRNDRGAQRRLYDAFAGRMMAVCLRYVKSRMEAEDVLQEAFVKVFEKIDTFRFESPLEGWVKKIVVNTALNYLRSQRQWSYIAPLESAENSVAEPALAPSGMHVQELLLLVQQLPPGCRAVFNLYAIEGYNHREIAELLGVTEGTSKAQYARARHLLQGLLAEAGRLRHGAG